MAKIRFLFILKISLASTLLYWLYISNALQLDVLNQLSFNLQTITLLSLNAILLFIGALLLSLRMSILLRVINFDIHFSEAVRVNLASMCLGLMLPGLMGVDAIRTSYICLRNKNRKIDAFTSIFIDRVIGIYALIVLASFAAVIGLLLNLKSIHSSFAFVSVSTLVSVTAGLSMLTSTRFRNNKIITAFFQRLPINFQKVISAIQHFSHFPKQIKFCLLISIVSQTLTISNFVIISILLKDSLPIIAHFIINPIALFLNAVPLTPGGLGITESAFAFLFQTAGSENGATIALIARINQYCVYIIIGLPALFLLKMDKSKVAPAPKKVPE